MELKNMKSAVNNCKKAVRFVLDTHLWKISHAKVVLNDYFQKIKISQGSNNEHMLSALNWIERAQDSTGNGGVAGRYHMNLGFTNSYPETSGHISPWL